MLNLAKEFPQGSVVGPVLFIVYHHDLLESLTTIQRKHLLTNDLAILFSSNSSLTLSNMIEGTIEQIVKDLNRLIDY